MRTLILIVIIVSHSIARTETISQATCTQEGMKDPVVQSLPPKFITKLCEGATSLMPIECYKKASADNYINKKIFGIAIANLCSGVTTLESIDCFKKNNSDPKLSKKYGPKGVIMMCTGKAY